MEHGLTVGDVVQMKSGGPKMTIDTIGKFGMGSTKDEAKCVWFDGTTRMEHLFQLSSLLCDTVDNAPVSQEHFNEGDVVQLKSGGPKMTIDTIGKFGMGSTHDEAKCAWFVGGKRTEALFEVPTLKKA